VINALKDLEIEVL